MRDFLAKIYFYQLGGNKYVRVKSHYRFRNGKREIVTTYYRAKWDTKR